MHSIIAFRQRAKTLETTTDLIIEISQQKTISYIFGDYFKYHQ